MPVDKKITTIIELAKKFLQMTISVQDKNPRVRTYIFGSLAKLAIYAIRESSFSTPPPQPPH